MDRRILLKKKELGREGGITGLSEVTVMGGYPMGRYDSREPFGFSMYVIICSTRGTTNVNKFALTALQRINTPSFVTVDMFALVVPHLFAV